MTRPRYFAIFGAMRTGSNLLETTLSQYPGLVGLGELFNPAFIGAPGRRAGWGIDLAARDKAPERLLEAVIAAHPGRVPGFRIFGGHDARLRARAAADPDCARIILTRAPLESYLSLRIAEATGQWLLRREEDRRQAKVRFDPAAFADYASRLEAEYAALRAAMRRAGAAWFEIDHADLSDQAALDGAARHAGATGKRRAAPAPILRQNPGPPAAKVTNPEDLPAGPAPIRATDDPTPVLSAGRGGFLLWSPVPGVAEASAAALVSEIEAARGLPARPPLEGLTGEQAERRLRRGATLFAFTRHPAARLAALFGALDAAPALAPLRARLRAEHGVEDLSDAGAFDAFLDLAEAALSGRAAPEPALAPQGEALAALAAFAPPALVMKAEAGPGPLLALCGLEAQPFAGRFRRRLGRTARLTPSRQARVFSLYRRDHLRLGYAPP